MWMLDPRHLPPGLLCSERLELVTEIAQQTGSGGVWHTLLGNQAVFHWKTAEHLQLGKF